MGWDDSGSEPYEVGEGEVRVVTEKALMFYVDATETEVWVPKSVIHEDSEIEEDADKGDEGILVVKEWFADKNEI